MGIDKLSGDCSRHIKRSADPAQPVGTNMIKIVHALLHTGEQWAADLT